MDPPPAPAFRKDTPAKLFAASHYLQHAFPLELSSSFEAEAMSTQKRGRASLHSTGSRRRSRRSSADTRNTSRLSPISELETPPRKRASREGRKSDQNWEPPANHERMPVVTGPLLPLRDERDLQALRKTLEPVQRYFRDVIDKHELAIEPASSR